MAFPFNYTTKELKDKIKRPKRLPPRSRVLNQINDIYDCMSMMAIVGYEPIQQLFLHPNNAQIYPLELYFKLGEIYYQLCCDNGSGLWLFERLYYFYLLLEDKDTIKILTASITKWNIPPINFLKHNAYFFVFYTDYHQIFNIHTCKLQEMQPMLHFYLFIHLIKYLMHISLPKKRNWI